MGERLISGQNFSRRELFGKYKRVIPGVNSTAEKNFFNQNSKLSRRELINTGLNETLNKGTNVVLNRAARAVPGLAIIIASAVAEELKIINNNTSQTLTSIGFTEAGTAAYGIEDPAMLAAGGATGILWRYGYISVDKLKTIVKKLVRNSLSTPPHDKSKLSGVPIHLEENKPVNLE